MFGTSLTIIVPILFIALSLFIFFVIRWNATKKDENANGRRIYNFDSRGRKVKSYDYKWNNNYDKYLMNNIKSEAWVKFDEAFKIFDSNVNERQFANLIINVKKTQKSDAILLKKIGNHNHQKNVLIKLSPILDSENFILTISWFNIKIPKKNNKKNKLTVLSKNDVINFQSKYIAFIAFNLDYGFPDIEKLFINNISHLFGRDKSHYFITSGMAVIVIGDNNINHLKGLVDKFIKKINDREISIGLNNLYNGTSYVISKEINSKSRVNTIIGALDFCINLSIRSGTNFMNKDDSEFNVDEYKAVTKANVEFRYAIKNKEIAHKEIPIRKIISNRKILSYAVPEISSITKELQKIILRNPQNNNLLINKFAEMIGIDNALSTPVLINVNDYWLIENYEKLKYKTAIYVINMYSLHSIHSKVVKHLKANGFTLAIKINKMNDSTRTAIKKMEPQFIIIDNELTNKGTSRSFIELISINKMAKSLGVKIIHENPTDNMKEKMTEEIGLKYYYNI